MKCATLKPSKAERERIQSLAARSAPASINCKGDDIVDKRKVLEEVIENMMEYYHENGREKPLEYTFGFMDALGAVRDLARAIAPVQNIGHPL